MGLLQKQDGLHLTEKNNQTTKETDLKAENIAIEIQTTKSTGKECSSNEISKKDAVGIHRWKLPDPPINHPPRDLEFTSKLRKFLDSRVQILAVGVIGLLITASLTVFLWRVSIYYLVLNYFLCYCEKEKFFITCTICDMFS